VELYLLVIYDISDDELRTRVADFLKAKGLVRVQRSAFIGPATTALRRDVEVGLRMLVRGRRGVNISPSFSPRLATSRGGLWAT